MNLKIIIKDLIISNFESISDLIFLQPRHKFFFNGIEKLFLKSMDAQVGNLVTYYP